MANLKRGEVWLVDLGYAATTDMARYVLDGAEHFIPVISEICWNCLHFKGEKPSERICQAFPDGIPLEIWRGENDHTKPFPNDKGIRFVHFKSQS